MLNTTSLEAFSKNLVKLLKEHNTNESELASKLNITYNTIHRLVNGTTSDPKLSTLQQVADYFNVSLDRLLSVHTHCPVSLAEGYYFLPILDWDNVQSTHFFETFNPEQWKRWLPVATQEPSVIHQNCYALESTQSMYPKFPIGTTFVINPDYQPMDGDLAIVRFKSDHSISLRTLVIDSPEWQLAPVIPGSKHLTIKRDEIDIIGVIVLTLIQTARRRQLQ